MWIENSGRFKLCTFICDQIEKMLNIGTFRNHFSKGYSLQNTWSLSKNFERRIFHIIKRSGTSYPYIKNGTLWLCAKILHSQTFGTRPLYKVPVTCLKRNCGTKSAVHFNRNLYNFTFRVILVQDRVCSELYTFEWHFTILFRKIIDTLGTLHHVPWIDRNRILIRTLQTLELFTRGDFDWCFSCWVGYDKIHQDIFTVHMLIDPIPNMG